jgi:hypothetical protein
VNRRTFLRSLAIQATALGALRPERTRAAEARAGAEPPSIRPITRERGFHWFGYYDKLQFSPDNRFVLGNEVQFEG